MNSAGEPAKIRGPLLAWYRRHAREMPWRSAPTPYHVLLSELMLQQTRVETVIPYFERFTARWPTLESLAAAEDDEVLAAWAGLGYYRRARSLLAAARAAVARGGLPSEAAALRELPGVGPYTAGAISSIAFGRPSPLVDGNVERVLSRLFGLEADPASPAGKRALWSLAGELVDPEAPGDFNQALMELGATVCVPRGAACGRCPLAEPCEARARGVVDSLPRKAPKRAPTPILGVAGLLWRGEQVLLGRRPAGGLLGGLWEPISGEPAPGEPAAEAVVRAFRERAGIEVTVERPLGELVHVFTHRRLRQVVFRVRAQGEREPQARGYDAVAWGDPSNTPLALSTLARKTLALGEVPALLAAEPEV